MYHIKLKKKTVSIDAIRTDQRPYCFQHSSGFKAYLSPVILFYDGNGSCPGNNKSRLPWLQSPLPPPSPPGLFLMEQ